MVGWSDTRRRLAAAQAKVGEGRPEQQLHRALGTRCLAVFEICGVGGSVMSCGVAELEWSWSIRLQLHCRLVSTRNPATGFPTGKFNNHGSNLWQDQASVGGAKRM